MVSTSNALQARKPELELALAKIAEIDRADKWAEIQSKDLPGELLLYVAESLSERPLDTIRKDLGIASVNDIRWRKIMTAIKGGIRIDATGIFLKWLRRNEQLSDKVGKIADRMLNDNIPFSKMLLQGLDSMANLQLSTIKMGKELGVFMDASQQQQNQGGGGQQVTIVVQTNVPLPDKATIEVHQEKQRVTNAKLLKDYADAREETK